MPRVIPLPSRLTPRHLPRKRGRLILRYKYSVQCRTPSRSDRFNGVTGGAGGPKGRNRNLPWPPCKKGYKETPFSFVYLNPSVTAYAVPAPRRGEPFGALYNSNIATAGRQCVKCSKIVYRLCNHMVYSFDILKASQKKRKRWRWLGRKGLWK